ncbi:hypothetical protein EVAR_96755_1 [Eumeta japonica]|uniref:Uncharacterized protein n=1 Tax=Eumeta variegata TaxID=151549 RepID=A0A4C1XZ00_EUMVA|nr:hypothetical protein EVAR_96755_1 [Eumeta japonica]
MNELFYLQVVSPRVGVVATSGAWDPAGRRHLDFMISPTMKLPLILSALKKHFSSKGVYDSKGKESAFKVEQTDRRVDGMGLVIGYHWHPLDTKCNEPLSPCFRAHRVSSEGLKRSRCDFHWKFKLELGWVAESELTAGLGVKSRKEPESESEAEPGLK